jgi:hypothetical protein
MGREIRRVPPNWEHPKRTDGRYQPMFETCYEETANDWLYQNNLWINRTHPDQLKHEDTPKYYWEWSGMPPEEGYHAQYKKEEATWYQVYETVSEGTPASPPFATQEELVNYLVEHGDFWNQARGEGGYSREASENFVYKTQFAFSGVMNNGILYNNIESCSPGAFNER